MLKCIKTLILKGVYYLDSWAVGIVKSSWWNHVWASLFILQTRPSYFATAPTEKVSQQHHLVLKISNWQSLMRLKKPFSQTEDKTGTFSTIRFFIYLKFYFLSFSVCILSVRWLFIVNNEVLDKLLGIITGTQTVRPVVSTVVSLLKTLSCWMKLHVYPSNM